MSEPKELDRKIYQHHWESLQEWVDALDDLADMTDDELDEIEVHGPERKDA